jgi:hypothetical protein
MMWFSVVFAHSTNGGFDESWKGGYIDDGIALQPYFRFRVAAILVQIKVAPASESWHVDPLGQFQKVVTERNPGIPLYRIRQSKPPCAKVFGVTDTIVSRNPIAASIPDHDLQPGASCVRKQKQVAAQRIAAKSIANQSMQSLKVG